MPATSGADLEVPHLPWVGSRGCYMLWLSWQCLVDAVVVVGAVVVVVVVAALVVVDAASACIVGAYLVVVGASVLAEWNRFQVLLNTAHVPRADPWPRP